LGPYSRRIAGEYIAQPSLVPGSQGMMEVIYKAAKRKNGEVILAFGAFVNPVPDFVSHQ
jgi:hypothetical protein